MRLDDDSITLCGLEGIYGVRSAMSETKNGARSGARSEVRSKATSGR